MRTVIISLAGPLFFVLAVAGYGIKFYKENFLFGSLVFDLALIGGGHSYNQLLYRELRAPSFSHKIAFAACIAPVVINSILVCIVIYNVSR